MLVKRKLGWLVLLCGLALTPLSSLWAQSPRHIEAAIPFDFWIGGSHLPAGDYIIEPVDSSTYFLFRTKDGKGIHTVYSVPLDEVPRPESEAKLVFKLEDGKHCLYEGWGPFGRRVLTGESFYRAHSGEMTDVPLVYR